MIEHEMGFEIQWEYVLLLGGILLIVVAFVYVLYNTTNSVREAVHDNFGAGRDNYVEAAPSNDTKTASVRLVLGRFSGETSTDKCS
jgi:hypothetical protein